MVQPCNFPAKESFFIVNDLFEDQVSSEFDAGCKALLLLTYLVSIILNSIAYYRLFVPFLCARFICF